MAACAPVVTPDSAAVTEIPAEATPAPGLTSKERLRLALQLLDEGDARQARAEVIAYLDQAPSSGVGRDLLLQIDTTPEIYYPEQYREITLTEGQSLSSISKAYLGNAYEFFALAKYNRIEEPGRVIPGQLIRVPMTREAQAAFAQEVEGEIAEQAKEGSSVDALAEEAAISEALDDVENAVGDSSEGAAAVSLEEPGDVLTEDDSAAGDDVAEQLSAGTPTGAAADPLPESPAIDLDDLHRQAISAYRSQDLDGAIALWDEILAVAPDYERARLYRSQAQALKERLKSLR